MLKTRFDLTDLEGKSERLISELDAKLDELDGLAPHLSVHDYMTRLTDQFEEVTFDPLDEVWEEEFRRLFDEGDSY